MPSMPVLQVQRIEVMHYSELILSNFVAEIMKGRSVCIFSCEEHGQGNIHSFWVMFLLIAYIYLYL